MRKVYEVSETPNFRNPKEFFVKIFDYFKWAKNNEKPFTIQELHKFIGVRTAIWDVWKLEENYDDCPTMREQGHRKYIITWTENIIECPQEEISASSELFEITQPKFDETGYILGNEIAWIENIIAENN